jgi:membrane protein implicated in regulation of membrane protease activity
MVSWLHGLYLFMTVFSVGVMAVDMLGLFGTGESDSDTSDLSADDASADDASADHTSAGAAGPLLSILRYLRIGTYFALGFGPVGLVAEWTGASVLGSLAWAVPGGVISAYLARLFFRFQQRDVNSQVRESELLLERAQVIVPLSNTNMGKVRIKMGQLVMERYALAEDEWETFTVDDQAEIVRVTDECVYVRRAI